MQTEHGLTLVDSELDEIMGRNKTNWQFLDPVEFRGAPTQKDLDLLRALDVAAVFVPDVGLMYGAGSGATVQPGSRAEGLCGGDRPGHFSGVLTVVAKLFGLTRPDIAVFGRKDAQQCLVIGQMVEDLAIPVRLIDAPTVREPDGLALSSRNVYLNDEQRVRACCLVDALRAGRRLLEAGERDAAALRIEMERKLAPADEVLYVEVRGVPDLDSPPTIPGRVLLAVSARVGATRLIDNFVLDVAGDAVRDSTLLGSGNS